MPCEIQVKHESRLCKREARYRVLVQGDGFNVCPHHAHHFEQRFPVAKLDPQQMPNQQWIPFS